METRNVPFRIVENENKTFITLGNYAVMQVEDQETAQKLIEEKDWELLINLICVTTEIYRKNENKTIKSSKKQRSTK